MNININIRLKIALLFSLFALGAPLKIYAPDFFKSFTPKTPQETERLNDIRDLYEKGKDPKVMAEIARRVTEERNKQAYIDHLEMMQKLAQDERNERNKAEYREIVTQTAQRLLEAFKEREGVKITPEQRAAAMPTIAKAAEILEANRDVLIKNIAQNRELMPRFLDMLEGGMRGLAEYQGAGKAEETVRAGKMLDTLLRLANDVSKVESISMPNRQRLARAVLSGITERTLPALREVLKISGESPKPADIVTATRTVADTARLIRESGIEMSPENAKKYADMVFDTLDFGLGKENKNLNLKRLQDFNEARAELIELTPKIARYLSTEDLIKFMQERFKYFKDAIKEADPWSKYQESIDSIGQIVEFMRNRSADERIEMETAIMQALGEMRRDPEISSKAIRALRDVDKFVERDAFLKDSKNIDTKKLGEKLRNKKGIDNFKEYVKRGFLIDPASFEILMSKAIEALGGKPERFIREVLFESKEPKDLKAEDIASALDILNKIDARERSVSGETRTNFQNMRTAIDKVLLDARPEAVIAGALESGNTAYCARFFYDFAEKNGVEALTVLKNTFEKYNARPEMLDKLTFELFEKSESVLNKKVLFDFMMQLSAYLDASRLERFVMSDARSVTAPTGNDTNPFVTSLAYRERAIAKISGDLSLQEKEKLFNADLQLLKALNTTAENIKAQNQTARDARLIAETKAQPLWTSLVKSDFLKSAPHPEQQIQDLFTLSSLVFANQEADQLYQNRNPEFNPTASQQAPADVYKDVLQYRLEQYGHPAGASYEVRKQLISFIDDLVARALEKNVPLTDIDTIIAKIDLKKAQEKLGEKRTGVDMPIAKRGLEILKSRLQLIEKLQSNRINELRPETVKLAFSELPEKYFDPLLQKVLAKKPSPETLKALAEVVEKNLEPIEKSPEAKKYFNEEIAKLGLKKDLLEARQNLLADLEVRATIGAKKKLSPQDLQALEKGLKASFEKQVANLANPVTQERAIRALEGLLKFTSEHTGPLPEGSAVFGQQTVNVALASLDRLLENPPQGLSKGEAFRNIVENIGPQLLAQMTTEQLKHLYAVGPALWGTTASPAHIRILELLTRKIGSIMEHLGEKGDLSAPLTTARVAPKALLEAHAAALENLNKPGVFRELAQNEESGKSIEALADALLKTTEIRGKQKKPTGSQSDFELFKGPLKALKSISDAIKMETSSEATARLMRGSRYIYEAIFSLAKMLEAEWKMASYWYGVKKYGEEKMDVDFSQMSLPQEPAEQEPIGPALPQISVEIPEPEETP